MSKETSNVNRIESQATYWFVRLQSPEATCEERDAFADWLIADAAHETAYFQVESLWADMDGHIDGLKQTPEIEAGYRYIEQLRRAATEGGRKEPVNSSVPTAPVPVTDRQIPHRISLRWSLLSAAASFLLMIGAGLIYWQHGLPDKNHYQTQRGEQRIFTLDDGSTMMLNTLTVLSVHYSDAERRIVLHEGQAHFRVQKDSVRPFVVLAGKGAVRALGTRFDVYKQSDQVTVTLLEGKVDVHALAAPGVAPVTPAEVPLSGQPATNSAPPPVLTLASARRIAELKPGEQLSYGPRVETAVPIVQADLKRVSAWRDRRLDFENTPLAEVIAEVNRYAITQIELSDERLKNAAPQWCVPTPTKAMKWLKHYNSFLTSAQLSKVTNALY